MAIMASCKGVRATYSEHLGTSFFCGGETPSFSRPANQKLVIRHPRFTTCSTRLDVENRAKLSGPSSSMPGSSERSSAGSSSSDSAPPRTRGSCSTSPSFVAATRRGTALLEQVLPEVDADVCASHQEEFLGPSWWLSADTAVGSAFDRSKLEVQWALTVSDPLPKLARDMPLLDNDSHSRVEELHTLSTHVAKPDTDSQPSSGASPKLLYTKAVASERGRELGLAGPSARQRRLQARLQRLADAKTADREQVILQRKHSTGQAPLDNHAKARGSNHENVLGTYVNQASRVKLLTKEEEVFLARKLRVYRELTATKQRLEEKLGRELLAPEWAAAVNIPVNILQQRIREGLRARRKLLTANMRLVVSVARNYINFGLDLADLVQAGNLGLCRGVERFDPDRGYKLSTYVHWWIRAAISKSLAETGQLLRLPLHVHETMCRVKKAQAKLYSEYKKTTFQELVKELDMSQRKLSNAMASVCRIRSLDSTISKRGSLEAGTSLYNFVPDTRSEKDMWNLLEDRCLKQEVDLLLSKLEPRQRSVLRTHYGFDRRDCVSLSFDDIKHRFGISRERVRQLETAALCKLRMISKSKELECYLRR